MSSWVSEPDTGIYNAMNKAIGMATGQYLLFLNSGDELISNDALQMAVDCVDGRDFYYFATEVRPEPGEGAPWVKNYPAELTFSYFSKDTLPHQSTLIKADIFKRFGLYDETLRICADWKHFMICICRHNCTYRFDPRVLGVFYLDGLSSKVHEQANHLAERQRVLEAEFPAFLSDTNLMFAGMHDSDMLDALRRSRTVRLLKKVGLVWDF